MKKMKKKRGRPPRGQQRSEEEIADSLRRNGGFVCNTADELGCYPSNITMRINRSKYLKNVLEEIKERNLDFAESKLFENMNNNEFNAICFYLKCMGKDRGYVETKSQIIVNANSTFDKIEGAMDAKDASSLYVNLIAHDEG